MAQINSETFLNFKSWDTFKKVNHVNIYDGFIINKCTEHLEQQFFDICMGKINNKLYIDKIQTLIIAKGYDYTTYLIIKLFENYYDEFYNSIQELIYKNNFNIKTFMQMQLALNNKLKKLQYLLFNIDFSYKINKNEKTKYSIINLIKNYVSYCKIINRTFIIEPDIKKYIYELFKEELEKDFNIETVISAYNISNFYTKFAYSADQNIAYFDPDLNKKIKPSDDILLIYLTNFINTINNEIIKLNTSVNYDSEFLEKTLKYIRILIQTAAEFCAPDGSAFMKAYQKSFIQRIKNINIDIEQEFLKSIDPQLDIETYIKIKNQINDVKLNLEYNAEYKTMDIEFKSEKYININIKDYDYDRNKTNFQIYRSYDWNYCFNYKKQYKFPIELALYLDVFNAYYKSNHSEDLTKIYEYNYDECIGEIQICNNLDKIYNIKMNILQLSVYYSLNKLINTPKNIAHELEMDLPTLGLIINSLLVSNLIYRKYESNPDQEKDQEPELKFYINLEFTHAENKLSAISNYNRLKLLLNN